MTRIAEGCTTSLRFDTAAASPVRPECRIAQVLVLSSWSAIQRLTVFLWPGQSRSSPSSDHNPGLDPAESPVIADQTGFADKWIHSCENSTLPCKWNYFRVSHGPAAHPSE